MKLNELLELAYYWLSECPRSTILVVIGHSPKTTTIYTNTFVNWSFSSLDNADDTIRGDAVILEIGESKFGKRKYNQGHRIEGFWVVGGIERTKAIGFFVEVVERRDAATSIDVISRHALLGSVVYTDC